MIVSFCVVLFSHEILDEILDLIESVSEGFPTYSSTPRHQNQKVKKHTTETTKDHERRAR